jgi:hypothetical protein
MVKTDGAEARRGAQPLELLEGGVGGGAVDVDGSRRRSLDLLKELSRHGAGVPRLQVRPCVAGIHQSVFVRLGRLEHGDAEAG